MTRARAFVLALALAGCLTGKQRPELTDLPDAGSDLCRLGLAILHSRDPVQGLMLARHATMLGLPATVVLDINDIGNPIECADETFRFATESLLQTMQRGFRLRLLSIDGGWAFEVTKEELNIPLTDAGEKSISIELCGTTFGTAERTDGGWHFCMHCNPFPESDGGS